MKIFLSISNRNGTASTYIKQVFVIQSSDVQRKEALYHFLYKMIDTFLVFFKTCISFWSRQQFELREYFDCHFARCGRL